MAVYRYVCKKCKKVIAYDPDRLKWEEGFSWPFRFECQRLFCPYCGWENRVQEITYFTLPNSWHASSAVAYLNLKKEDLNCRGRLYCPECGQTDGLPIVNPLWVR